MGSVGSCDGASTGPRDCPLVAYSPGWARRVAERTARRYFLYCCSTGGFVKAVKFRSGYRETIRAGWGSELRLPGLLFTILDFYDI